MLKPRPWNLLVSIAIVVAAWIGNSFAARANTAIGTDSEPTTKSQIAPKVSGSAATVGSQSPNTTPQATGSQPVTGATSAQSAASGTRYYVHDVGQLPADGSFGLFRINQSGQMIWNSKGHAFVYQNCQSRDLGHLGGGQSFASAINGAGVIVGKSMQAGGRWRAFAYTNGKMRDLGGSTDKQINENATGINYWGDMVGVESVTGGLSPTAVRYQDGVAAPMARILIRPPAGWASIANVIDLNDSKYVVGSLTDSGAVLAFLSTNFGSLWTKINGVAGLESATTPRAMNRYGHVTGVAGNGLVRAFVSRDPSAPAIDLGTLGGSLSMGLGINNYGRVVGWAEQTTGGGPRAFVHDGARMIDLNSVLWNGAGWLLREAMAINDAGQIVGEGFLNGQARAFFLQPMAQAPVTNPCRPVVATQ